jgi:hypothetical protein
MTSVTGEPYSSLPTAFKYRTSLDTACTCKPPGGYSIAMSTPQSGGPIRANDPTAPLPRSRPAPGEDPETLADRIGSYVPHTSVAGEAAAVSAGASSDNRSIRVVGPAYWGNDKDQDSLVIAPVPN